jgi:hypothetical protein
MVQSTIGRVLTDLEREIGEEIRSRPPAHETDPFAPPSVRAPALAMPQYVEHRDGATEYEAAAKEIEAMGVELIERVKQCEAMTRDALAVTGELNETARRYREEAKRVFVEIENCSRVTAEVRQTCTDLKEKIAVKPELP